MGRSTDKTSPFDAVVAVTRQSLGERVMDRFGQRPAFPTVEKRRKSFEAFVSVPITVDPDVSIRVDHIGQDRPSPIVGLRRIAVSPGVGRRARHIDFRALRFQKRRDRFRHTKGDVPLIDAANLRTRVDNLSRIILYGMTRVEHHNPSFKGFAGSRRWTAKTYSAEEGGNDEGEPEPHLGLFQ